MKNIFITLSLSTLIISCNQEVIDVCECEERSLKHAKENADEFAADPCKYALDFSAENPSCIGSHVLNTIGEDKESYLKEECPEILKQWDTFFEEYNKKIDELNKVDEEEEEIDASEPYVEESKKKESSYTQEVTHWIWGNVFDEFGDATGEHYLVYTDKNAKFSNSATTADKLIVEVYLLKGELRMKFDEYAGGNFESFYGDWKATVKFLDGSKRTSSLRVFSDELAFYPKLYEEILTELKEKRTVKFFVFNDGFTEYSFQIKGFNGLDWGLQKLEEEQ